MSQPGKKPTIEEIRESWKHGIPPSQWPDDDLVQFTIPEPEENDFKEFNALNDYQFIDGRREAAYCRRAYHAESRIRELEAEVTKWKEEYEAEHLDMSRMLEISEQEENKMNQLRAENKRLTKQIVDNTETDAAILTKLRDEIDRLKAASKEKTLDIADKIDLETQQENQQLKAEIERWEECSLVDAEKILAMDDERAKLRTKNQRLEAEVKRLTGILQDYEMQCAFWKEKADERTQLSAENARLREAIKKLISAHNSVVSNFMDQTAYDQWQAACLFARQAAKGE